ncbi:MAG: FMN-binding negative transcriptional regulator [Cytophagales bacterium]|nr:FMN-binding negative transcriptional regulator [Rhizobacter sp.]
MYTPKHFLEERPEALHQLVHDHPLGLLITLGPQGMDATPIPFLLDTEPGGSAVLRAHVARANPVWREARTDVDTLVVFQGPQAYISPGWYPSKAENGKTVPTWNYITVQARGRLVVHDDAEWLRGLVTRLTQRHEAVQAKPWAVTDAPPDYIDAMLRAIVGIEIPLASLTGKWKMSQNHTVANREGVARGLRELGDEQAMAVAAWVERGGAPGSPS